MRYGIALLIVLGLLFPFPPPSAAAGVEQPRCARCNMPVDEASPFSARIVSGTGTSWFCDIGDLVLFLREKKTDPALAEVKDYRSGAWIAATQALYVSSPKQFRTPMGWGLAAFRDRNEAASFGQVDDLAAILKRLE